jgi:hypothetical protein
MTFNLLLTNRHAYCSASPAGMPEGRCLKAAPASLTAFGPSHGTPARRLEGCSGRADGTLPHCCLGDAGVTPGVGPGSLLRAP